jgi:DNA end-binding protein Ku
MKGDFDPAALNDRERAAVIELLKEKQRALPATADRKAKVEPSRTNIVNLMDALKKSLAAGKQSSGAPPAKGKRQKAAYS